MTIPSALTLLVNVFPEPTEQARAIGVFGGCGAVGNGEKSYFCSRLRTSRADHERCAGSTVLGLIIGAIFVQYASWSWVFWFVALVCMPIAALCVFLIPKQEPRLDDIAARGEPRWKSLDIIGVSILTGALVSLYVSAPVPMY